MSLIAVLQGFRATFRDPEAALAGIRPELARHVAAHPAIVVTSAVRGTGIPELRAAVAALAIPE